MTLTPQDGALFYQLMWKLQYYVNQKLGHNKNIASIEEYANLPTKKKLVARNALWEHPELIEAFAEENPNNLTDEELEIVRRWKGFVKDSFFIFRHLKKGSIFIGKDNRVFIVHGIQDPLGEIMPSYALPQMVQAILLPFKGQIIYDGLLEGYNIHFGGGIRSSMKETYDTAKAKDRIIVTLEPETMIAKKPAKPKKDIRPRLKEIQTDLDSLKGNTLTQNAALNLARLSLDLALIESESPPLVEIAKQARKIQNATARLLKQVDALFGD